jgi:hypothetical protein
MRAPSGDTEHQHFAERVLGEFPWALQRALELQAAFELMSCFHPAVISEDRREWLAEYSPRALHGFIGSYLKRHPERRVIL